MHYFNLIILFQSLLCKWIQNADGKASFTKTPPSVKYALQGQTVRLVWEYRVDNRDKEFEMNSPRWDFYASDGTVLAIASEDSQYGWQWALHANTCPKRLLKRVSKESDATLVITNVTTDDNGVYGCSLVLKLSSALTNKVNIIVTTPPYFTRKPPLVMRINESHSIAIPCSANGSPKPNVTWKRLIDNKTVLISKGIGSASLHILNMTRNKSGNYRCQARNNPIENPVEATINIYMSTEVAGSYTASPRVSTQFLHLPPQNNRVIEGMDLELNCSANGNPSPNVTWFHLRNESKVMKSNGIGRATLSIRNIRRNNSGTYECRAVNEKETLSFFTTVMVMCYCSTKSSTNSTEMNSKLTSNEIEEPLPKTELTDERFMIALLTVTCISVLINILLIIYICLKVNGSRYNVANKDKDTIRFAAPSISQKAGSEELNDSTPDNAGADSNAERLSFKPVQDIYESIPETERIPETESILQTESISELPSTNIGNAYDKPTDAKDSHRSNSARNKDDEKSLSTSRLRHIYQDLDDFASKLNLQEYQSLDKSEVVANPHPKHASVSKPFKYEMLTIPKKHNYTEYQKLHIYTNAKDATTRSDK